MLRVGTRCSISSLQALREHLPSVLSDDAARDTSMFWHAAAGDASVLAEPIATEACASVCCIANGPVRGPVRVRRGACGWVSMCRCVPRRGELGGGEGKCTARG